VIRRLIPPGVHNIHAYTSGVPTNFVARESKSRFGSDLEAEKKFPTQCEMSAINSADGFKAWGYMPDHQHFQLGYVALEVGSLEGRGSTALLSPFKGVLTRFSTIKGQSSPRRLKAY
jgi:hypothetical protein